ncbi:hypothetical protein BDB00DRAFT_832891 [Zychaea mexicana]|uniref:uncharacterized protein n=1 Tax=Zychaea mexicana TaxID=64656 RepID=UPI0022FEF190|nr:uncharacterized protein BDB00DRAFT_832891 [Zychaea mexicana]KAI9491415.1 hypothetical protein BDB00DRAFT_832891 [Zychaea mexicana]
MPDEQQLYIILPIVIIGFVLAMVMCVTLIYARTHRQRYVVYTVPAEEYDFNARSSSSVPLTTSNGRRGRSYSHHHNHYSQVSIQNNTEGEPLAFEEPRSLNLPPPAYNEHRGDVRIPVPRN